MIKSGLFLLMCGCVLLTEAPASGEEPNVDCDNATTQMELNYCTEKEYEEADAALNSQWKLTKKAVIEQDRNLEENLRGAEKALVRAQRAWIEYRDGQCEAESFQARGGTAEPMLLMSCLAELTRVRTEQLQELAESIDGG